MSFKDFGIWKDYLWRLQLQKLHSTDFCYIDTGESFYWLDQSFSLQDLYYTDNHACKMFGESFYWPDQIFYEEDHDNEWGCLYVSKMVVYKPLWGSLQD